MQSPYRADLCVNVDFVSPSFELKLKGLLEPGDESNCGHGDGDVECRDKNEKYCAA